MKYQYLTALLALLIGCGWLGAAIRTTLDIARCLCESVAAEQSPDKLGGMTPGEWCEVADNVRPFVDEVTKARVAASRKAGLSRVAP